MHNDHLWPLVVELIENSGIMISLIKGNKFAFVNPALQAFLGYSREELYHMDFWDIAHPDYRDILCQKGMAWQAGEEMAESCELPLLSKVGDILWIQINSRNVSIGGEAALIIAAFDINERKAREDDLLRQREPLRLILDNNPVATILVDSEGKTLYVSSRFTELTGYTIEDIGSSQVWEEKVLLDMPNRREIMLSWRQYLAKKGYSKGRVIMRLQDGKRRFFNIHSVALPDGHVVLAAWDISDQVKAQKVLRESEARFKALSEASFESIIITENAICIEANQAAERLFARNRKEIIGLNVLDIIAPEAREKVKSQLMGASEAPYAAAVVRPDGSRIPVEVQGRVFIYQGNRVRVVGIRDLSERRRAEEEIYRQSTNLQALFYNTPDAVALCDSMHRIIDVNPRFYKLFGYNIEECQGRNLGELFIPDELGEEYELSEEVLSRGKAISWESVRKKRNGELLAVLITLIPIAGSGYYVLYRDICERKKAETTIQQQIKELEIKNAEMERFVYTISHDLRSPLITIKGFSGLILQDLEKGKSGRLQRDIQRIINAASKMQELLEDLLELSRIGHILSPFTSFSMKRLFNEVLELLSGPISEEKVKIKIAAPYMPWVVADRGRIGEVIQNLLENAIKFMGSEENPQIEIGYFRSNAEYTFSIKDNGVGIEAKYQEKIFGLFDKLDQNTDGTGIGLALVKRIIELHHGRIWVESAGAGQGSTFYFTLPAAFDSEKEEK